jgi:hypothetical protein
VEFVGCESSELCRKANARIGAQSIIANAELVIVSASCLLLHGDVASCDLERAMEGTPGVANLFSTT